MSVRVLVIDDDPKGRELVKAVLDPDSFLVRTADRGVSGLTQADADPPDVIVLDVQMPGMDGYEVCRVLRHGKKTRGVPIVMLTACDDTSLNRQAFAAGAQMCVTKPFRREALVAAITVALQMTPEQ
jgi:two-component system cell cycle response regulator/putative two-component system response regulator